MPDLGVPPDFERSSDPKYAMAISLELLAICVARDFGASRAAGHNVPIEVAFDHLEAPGVLREAPGVVADVANRCGVPEAWLRDQIDRFESLSSRAAYSDADALSRDIKNRAARVVRATSTLRSAVAGLSAKYGVDTGLIDARVRDEVAAALLDSRIHDVRHMLTRARNDFETLQSGSHQAEVAAMRECLDRFRSNLREVARVGEAVDASDAARFMVPRERASLKGVIERCATATSDGLGNLESWSMEVARLRPISYPAAPTRRNPLRGAVRVVQYLSALTADGDQSSAQGSFVTQFLLEYGAHNKAMELYVSRGVELLTRLADFENALDKYAISAPSTKNMGEAVVRLGEAKVVVRLDRADEAGEESVRIAISVPSKSKVECARAALSNRSHERLGQASVASSLFAKGVAGTAVAVLDAFSAQYPNRELVVNAWIDSVDPATGADTRTCVLSVAARSSEIAELRLDRLDPVACVKALSGAVSKAPGELSPVRPIVDFDKTDDRFVDSVDLASTLDSRPNLLELSPTDFEQLIDNLFTAMGLDTRLTRASRDGGIDCVAYDHRPVVGGKVVIQAKRYARTVGVSAVRDLFGATHNEGANKGILVTTSRFGKGSYAFASNKPLELIDGPQLLYLLQEHLAIQARIVVPQDWVDPDG